MHCTLHPLLIRRCGEGCTGIYTRRNGSSVKQSVAHARFAAAPDEYAVAAASPREGATVSGFLALCQRPSGMRTPPQASRTW